MSIIISPEEWAIYGAVDAATTTLIIDGPTTRIAAKFYPRSTSPIEAVAFVMSKAGTVTDINFKAQICANNADIPGSALGGTTPEFAGVGTDSTWINWQTLAANTGTLSLDAALWLDVFFSSGSNPTASNYIRFRGRGGVAEIARGETYRSYNGTNWTTRTAQIRIEIPFIVRHVDGTISGWPVLNTNGPVRTWASDIYGTNRQAVGVKFGMRARMKGIRAFIAAVGSPANLQICYCEGATIKHTTERTAAEVGAAFSTARPFYFDAPIFSAPNKNCYIMLRQKDDGGDSSKYYSLYCYGVLDTTTTPALTANVSPAGWDVRAGTGDDPTAMTAYPQRIPIFQPVFDNPVTDLQSGLIVPASGLIGGLR